MNILFLTNNKNTKSLQDWLHVQNQNLDVISGKVNQENIKKIKPDLVISYNYKHMISQEVIDEMKGNIINLHVSYLPWNKGSNPNIWSIIDDTPKGVSIHYVDQYLDNGKIISQKKILLNETETLRSSYEKLQSEIQDLFKSIFKDYSFWKNQAVKSIGEGSYHTNQDFKQIEALITNWDMPIKELKEKYDKWKTPK